MNELQALFLDLSGVVYEGDRLVDGAVETVETARNKGLTIRFVTNTSTKSRRQILEKLRGMEIPLEDDELFTAPMAAQAYLRAHGLHPYCLVHENLKEDFSEFVSDAPDAVVLGDARDGLRFETLNRAFGIVQAGHPLIGIGYNKYFRDGDELKLDAGAFIHALEWAAGTEAVITGKPSRAFFDEVVASTDHEAGECLMVGDDAAADVAAAIQAGLRGLLVRTGKFEPGDEKDLPDSARVIDSITELF